MEHETIVNCAAAGNHAPELVVMLTHNDRTVAHAEEVFEKAGHSKALWWGMKEDGLPLERMKVLYERMRSQGKKTALEVVAYTEEECLAGVRMGIACQVDMIMGTLFFDSICELCQECGIAYFPFVGTITGRPSVLEGTLEDMVAEAQSCLDKGASGIDLLGYRYTGDAVQLNKDFVASLDAPVCLAGSVNSVARLDEVKDANPWAFTIGGAFFEGAFIEPAGLSSDEQADAAQDEGEGESESKSQKALARFAAQVDFVCDYMRA